MLRRRLTLAMSIAALVVLAGACGGGGGGGGGGDRVAADAWLGDFCGALTTWQTALTDGAPDLSQLTDLEQAKTGVSSYLEGAVSATDTLVADIEAAGVPDVDDGEAISRELQTAISDVGQSFSVAKADVDALSTDDAAAFAAGLQGIGATLTEAGTAAGQTFDQLSEKYPASDLEAVVDDVASCDVLQ